jgi:hypothetical protein
MSTEGQPILPTDVLHALQGQGACVRAKLGQIVRPLEDETDTANGLLRDTASAGPMSQLKQALANLINDPTNPKFTDVFGDPAQATNAPNYPFLRWSRAECLLSWPPFDAEQNILLGSMGSWQWTSPLCHDRRIPLDARTDTGSGVSRVKKVRVMLVAPGVDADYCDYRARYNLQLENAISPYAASLPTVVGFLDLNLFDFNFDELSTFANDTPNYPRPSVGDTLRDLNPQGSATLQ